MGDSLARSLPIMRLGCSSSTSHGELGGVPHAGCAASRCSCAQGDAMPTGACAELFFKVLFEIIEHFPDVRGP